MPKPEHVMVTLDDRVLAIRLNRPDRLNAVTAAMLTDIAQGLERAEKESEVRCVLLCASGRGFCAGRDLSDAQAGEDAASILAETMNPLIQSLYGLRMPTVAAVNGVAMGFGLGLALACDLVLASRSAKFGVPFARLGGALDCGGHYFLSRRVGANNAMDMIYTAEPVDGQRALAMGLAQRCYDDADLASLSWNIARRLAAGPSGALMRQKQLIRDAARLELPQVLDLEAKLQGDLALTDDYREGLAAFVQKREPRFS